MPTSKTSRPVPVRIAPLAPIALAVVVGIVVDRCAEPLTSGAWFWVAVGFATLSFACWKLPRTSVLGIIFSSAALAGGWHHVRWSDLKNDDLARGANETPTPCWLRGTIRDVLGFKLGEKPDDKGYTRAILEINEVNDAPVGWRTVSGRAMVGIVGDRSDLRAGDPVETAGKLSLVQGPLNPGEFDYRDYLQAQGIRLKLSVDGPKGVWRAEDSSLSATSSRWSLVHAIGTVRSWSQTRLTEGLDAQTAPLAAALLLGRREGVDPDVNDAFARTGTTHLLAISGLHMQVLALALGGFLRMLRVPRRASFKAVMIATIAYTLLVGLMPSVVRSAAMTITFCIAGLMHRPSRAANTLATAALATLALNPAHLFDVGCQLSFLAVAAIVWGAGPAWNRLKILHNADPLDVLERKFESPWKGMIRTVSSMILQGVMISVVVWLAAIPLTSFRFHIVSPIGILLNVPLIPITSLALLASGISLGLAAIWGPLGTPAEWTNAALLRWTEWIVRWGAAQRWGHWFVAEPSWVWVVAFYVLLGLTVVSRSRQWRSHRIFVGAFVGSVIVGLLLATIPSLTSRSTHGPPEAIVLAVGHGLAVVIDTGGGHAVLYDCGKMRDPSVGRRVIAPALWSRGIRRLDAVILSHADADHYDGLPDLLDRLPIEQVLVPEGFAGGEANPGTAELLDLARSRGAKVRNVAAGESWKTGETTFRVRHPAKGWNPSASDNARSIVLDVFHGRRHLLLTGDLDGQGLVTFTASRSEESVDVMLSPHHGGKTANPGWLYDHLAPKQVVVSQRAPVAGTRDALSILDVKKIPLWRTWRHGALRLSWTKTGIKITGFLDKKKNGSTADSADKRR